MGKGKFELQILVSFSNAEEALKIHKKRWKIVPMFRNLKSSDFNIEVSHVSIYIYKKGSPWQEDNESFQIGIRVHLKIPSEPY